VAEFEDILSGDSVSLFGPESGLIPNLGLVWVCD